MPNTLRTVIISVVAAVWAINFIAPVFEANYKPAPELNVAFMAIIGVLTASYRREEDDEDEKRKRRRQREQARRDDQREDDGGEA